MKKIQYRIYKEIKFSASHTLKGMPPDHQCARLHGHNYRVEVELVAVELDDTNMVLDFGVIGGLVKEKLDHQDLNAVMKCENPTAEFIANWIYELINIIILKAEAEGDVKCDCVKVWETDTCWAEVRFAEVAP